MSNEYIDTKQGYLSAKLWHCGAYLPMQFDNNFHAPIHGKQACEQLRDALVNLTNNYYINGHGERGCNFHIGVDNDGLCVLTYKGTYRENFSSSVLLTETGRQRLIGLLNEAIAQAFTPEQIAEREEHHRQWEIGRDKRMAERESKQSWKFW